MTSGCAFCLFRDLYIWRKLGKTGSVWPDVPSQGSPVS
jgi:hypothetical protein